ncbi:MAG: phage minor capsid protein [Clostridiales bacterium]|nr:phage minor capsid protein [Clostridiales bacterium]
MQNRIFADVVRRIRKTGGITSTADYQLQKVQILGNSTEFIESEIKRITEMTDAQLWELYDNAANEDYTRNRDLYEQINGNFIPYEENLILQSWVYAAISQTRGEIKNITNSMGMTVNMGAGKKAFTPLAEYYQKYLDQACVDIVTGSFSYDTILRRVVKEMTASGIRTVDYASGWSNRVPVAARRAVMTGVHQLSNQINEKVAKELGTNDYEVSWHSGFRPDHWWGGLVFSYEELRSICRLGEVTGLCGANCYHSYTAFIKGVSVRTYTDEQLAEMNAREKETHSFQGKQYNAYEASQQQRKLETLMRQQRANVKNLKDGKADEETVMAARAKYLNTLHQYQAFSKKMGLPEQMERVYMDGLGRIAPYKESLSGTGYASRTSRSRKKAAESIFNIQPKQQGDVVSAQSLYKNLQKSDTGKGVFEYIKQKNTSVEIFYSDTSINEMNLEGCKGRALGNHIYINGKTAQSVEEITKAIIHEEKHIELGIGGDQHSEAVCDYFAELHTKGQLTGNDMRSIIKSVKERYPEYKWRWR